MSLYFVFTFLLYKIIFYRFTLGKDITADNIKTHTLEIENAIRLSELSEHDQLNENLFSKYDIGSNFNIFQYEQNGVKDIPEDLFSSNKVFSKQFTVVEMNHSSFEQLPENLFHSLKELQELIINKNHLKTVHPYLFVKNLKLKTLNLQRNKLKILPAGIFRHNRALETLQIGDNEIEHLPNEFINPNIENKIQIYLENNNLNHIDYKVLNSKIFPKIKMLQLSHNSLVCLPEHFIKMKSTQLTVEENCFKKDSPYCQQFKCNEKNPPKCSSLNYKESKKLCAGKEFPAPITVWEIMKYVLINNVIVLLLLFVGVTAFCAYKNNWYLKIKSKINGYKSQENQDISSLNEEDRAVYESSSIKGNDD